MFVSGVVVDHQMNVQILGNLLFDQFQKPQKLLVTVAGRQSEMIFPVAVIERREQGGGPVAFVVMGHGSRPSGFERQRTLGAFHRLDLGLFVHAQHHRPFGRIQVQTHHVHQFLLKPRISGQLERPGSPGLQSPGPSRPGPRCLFPPGDGRPSSGSTNASTRPGDGCATCPKLSVPPPRGRSPGDVPCRGVSLPPPPRRPRRSVSARPAPCRPSPPPAGRSPRSVSHQQPTTALAWRTFRNGADSDLAIRSNAARCSTDISNGGATKTGITQH